VPAAVLRDEISCDDLSGQPNPACMISYDIQFHKNFFREIKFLFRIQIPDPGPVSKFLTVRVQTFHPFWVPDPGPVSKFFNCPGPDFSPILDF
jgi:hypothetical protein